jgi:hypothetical protein
MKNCIVKKTSPLLESRVRHCWDGQQHHWAQQAHQVLYCDVDVAAVFVYAVVLGQVCSADEMGPTL